MFDPSHQGRTWTRHGVASATPVQVQFFILFLYFFIDSMYIFTHILIKTSNFLCLYICIYFYSY